MLGDAFFLLRDEGKRRWLNEQALRSSVHALGQHATGEGRAMHMSTAVKRWTLEELHSLPDDGNKYELIDGELFVTPAPTDYHETLSAKLTRLLDPFVERNGLGYVYHPRAVVRVGESEVEPDLMVRQPQPPKTKEWEHAPRPTLVIEIISPTTRRRDYMHKRDFYLRIGIAEYWILDPERQAVTVARPGEENTVADRRLSWNPAGVAESLEIDVYDLFDVGPDNPPGSSS
jgi:Uma2 family endonuclease